MTARPVRTTLVPLCLVLLASGAEPALIPSHEPDADGQAETRGDLARPPESPAEHVRVIQVCSREDEAPVGIAFLTWPSQHKGAYVRYDLEEHVADWPPLAVVSYDDANELITHTFFRGRTWTNEEFVRAFPEPCALLLRPF